MGSIPQGKHNAICTGVVFTGTLKSINGFYKKVTILWEIFLDDGRKREYSRQYTYSYHEGSILRQHLESWRGRAFTKDELDKFQIRNIIGVPCRLEITKNSKMLKQIDNVLPFPKGEVVPVSEIKPIYFDIEDEDTYSDFIRLPGYLAERIKQTPEYKKSKLSQAYSDEDITNASDRLIAKHIEAYNELAK